MLEPEPCPHPVEPRVLLVHEVGAVGVGAQAQRRAPACRRSSAARRRSARAGPTRGRTRSICATDIAAISAPSAARTAPGSMNRSSGCGRAGSAGGASRRGSSTACDSPPRGWYSIGISRISSRSLAARITISDANSMPVVRRSRRGSAVPAYCAHAAVRVPHAGAEEEVEDAREHRVADVAVQPRHRARLDVVHPVAHHEVGAVLELLDEARDLGEVVREVGVGHHDVARRGRRRSRPGRRCRSRAAARGTTRAPAAAASSALRVLGRVVGDDDLAVDPVLVQRVASARRTQRSMFSASLRQGITTETEEGLIVGCGGPG